MKMYRLVPVTLLLLVFPMPQVAHANMAAPANPDVGSSITFEKNDEISVVSEVLDITVDGAQADFVVTYTMVNTTEERVVTPSMFLSPNVESGGVQVCIQGEPVPFTVERYALNFTTEIQTEDWQYVVLSQENAASPEERTVDAIGFQLDFEPEQEYQVEVSYTYHLGGYPTYDFDVKRGDLEYYLRPAALWKDFSSLTINLHLDEEMPVLKNSTVEFERVGPRTYQYTSQELPKENLRITIDESWWQTIFSTLRSPYLGYTLLLMSPVILVALVCVIVVIWLLRRAWKARR